MSQQVQSELAESVRAQARVRAIVGLPLIIGVSAFLSQHGSSQWQIIASIHGLYISMMLALTTEGSKVRPTRLAMLTAVLDPLMLSAWLPHMNAYGGLVLGFYLFTTLGFGFRTGQRLMQVCQVSSILGFSAVLLVESYWQQNFVIWMSYLIALVVVPLYATVLIKKLHEARARAELESRAKSDLLARVSHELRTPLTGIMAATQLLAGETKDKKAGRRAETILSLSRDLLDEINDLLDQSKYEANSLELDLVPINILEQIEKVRRTLEPTALKKRVGFHVSMDPRISEWVLGDPHYLSRILINLAGNGVKFTDQGEVRIEVLLLSDERGKYNIRFLVRDTGIGIPREYHHRIFEPFFQVSTGSNRRFGGTGLGMTLAREIITLMGGDLELESEPGKGSSFQFDLSFARVEEPQQGALEQVVVPVVRDKRILVVDDHETNLMLVKELLEQDGHQVAIAKSGMDALETLTKRDFDLLFLDFNLGDMDGVKLLQLYRFGRLRPAPAFFLTADATLLTNEKLKNSGAAGVLNKPLALAELRRAISQTCGSIAEPVSQGTQSRPVLKAVPTQAIDPDTIEHLKSISERPEFLRELLVHAQSDIQQNGIELMHALSVGDAESVRDAAHALKGVCASVGATRLMALANILVRATRDDVKRSGARMKADIAEASRVTIEAISAILDEFDGMQLGDRAARSPLGSS